MKFYTTSKISENMHETPEGFLVCVGVSIARTGEMVYGKGETPLEVGEDGTITISRDEKEVFRPETMASFEGKSLTIGHPNDFVDPKNWKQLTTGVVQNVRRGEGEQSNDLVADLLVTDGTAIGLVKGGLREVSCGYEADYVQTGIGRGVQKFILGNHLALVDEGRAGSSYAINDHKGKGLTMNLKEKIKAIFAKAQDEAMSLASDAEKEVPAEKKDDKAKDAAAGYDELMKMVKDLGEKISGMAKPEGKDATKPASESSPAETVAKDEDVNAGLEDRLKALEASVAKLLEGMSSKDEDMDNDESEDADGEEDDGDGDESEDDDFEESTMTGDTASRVEILAPGLKSTVKDAKAKALKAAYATKDGKIVIDQLTGGKAPELKDEAKVNVLFIAASELLKVSRTSALSKTKQTRDFDSTAAAAKGAMTAEQMNAINAKHYGSKN